MKDPNKDIKELIALANAASTQTECNHVIGLAYVWENKWDESQSLIEVYIDDGYQPLLSTTFRYCPLCGVSLVAL
jgi:hypothetical protein